MSRRDPAKEEHWRETIKAHGASNMSVRAFCRERGVSEHSFHSWRRKLRADEARPSPEFAEEQLQQHPLAAPMHHHAGLPRTGIHR